MEARRESLLCCRPMVCRMNLWRIILGSGGRAVFTKPFCSCSHKVLTIRLPKPTKNGWTCLFKAMHWPNWRTENSGENRYLHLSCSGKGIRAEFCSIKCTDLTLRRKQIQGTRSKVFSKPWEIQKLSSIWKSLDLFLHYPCGPAVGWQRRPGKNHERQIHGSWRGLRTAWCYGIPVCLLQYIAADPRITCHI